jgi:hypothetical protein
MVCSQDLDAGIGRAGQEYDYVLCYAKTALNRARFGVRLLCAHCLRAVCMARVLLFLV